MFFWQMKNFSSTALLIRGGKSSDMLKQHCVDSKVLSQVHLRILGGNQSHS